MQRRSSIRVPFTIEDEPPPSKVKIDRLLGILESEPHSTGSIDPYFNPWYEHQSDAIRLRGNLRRFLEARERASILMVAEAPGYLGARKSGVPLTDPRSLDPSSKEKPENTATRIYATLRELAIDDEDVLLWNVFPFHPYNPPRQDTNRSVRFPEAREYADLTWLLGPTSRRFTIAVGRKAERGLQHVGIECSYVHHPSRSTYYPAFRADLAQVLRVWDCGQ